MKGVLGDLMRQAQRVQEDMQRAQEELGRTECTGEAGAGLVIGAYVAARTPALCLSKRSSGSSPVMPT